MEKESSVNNAVILMYHRIADDGTDLCVSPATFRGHLGDMKEAGYRVLPLCELASALQQDAVPEKSLAITFDDGYLDALTHAAPILQEFDFPATFFIISSTLNGPSEFWWETLERVFAYDGLPTAINVALPEGIQSMPTKTPQERHTAFETVRGTYYSLTLEQRSEQIETLMSWSGLSPVGEGHLIRGMTAEEVRVLDRLPGMEIGAHTENHLLLPAQSRETKEREIYPSKQRIEELLEREVVTFSYPYGAFDEESVELTKRAGFKIAVATGNQKASPHSHPLILPRYAVRAADNMRSRLDALFAAPCGGTPT